jgi:hypothetical protein
MNRGKRVRVALRVVFLVAGCSLFAACSDPDNGPAAAIAEVQASHIEANAPAREDFERLLKRELTAYFLPTPSEGADVEYEFLRDAPTQSGVSYPKYYLWVRVNAGGSVQQEGAVRVAAIGRDRFEVTDFLTRDQISSTPSQIYQVFPAPVCDRIEERIRK